MAEFRPAKGFSQKLTYWPKADSGVQRQLRQLCLGYRPFAGKSSETTAAFQNGTIFNCRVYPERGPTLKEDSQEVLRTQLGSNRQVTLRGGRWFKALLAKEK